MKLKNKSKINASKLFCFVSAIINRIFTSLSNSRIISFFSSKFSNIFDDSNSGLIHLPLNKSVLFNNTLSLRLFIARMFEKSVLASVLRKFYRTFYTLPLRTIAVFLLTYGVSLSVLSSVTSTGFYLANQPDRLYIGIVVACISVILFPTKKNFIQCLKQSKILSGFVFDNTSGIFKDQEVPEFRGYYSTAFFLGTIVAIASLVFSPSKVLLFIVASFSVCMIFDSPETGLLLNTVMIPFFSTGYVIFITFVTLISFFLKYFRGKRHLNTKGSDILVFISIPLFLFTGIFTSSGYSDILHATKFIFCFIIVLLTSNLIRSTKTALNCVTMMINSAFAVVIFNIILFVLQNTEIAVEFSRHFSVNMMMSVLNIFSGYELSIFSSCTLPLVFNMLINSQKNERSKYILLFAMLSICIIISGNELSFCISILSLIIVLAFKNKTYSYLFIPYFIFIKFISLIPSFILDVFGNRTIQHTKMLPSISIPNLLNILRDYGLFGIGFGEDNISAVISSYHASNVTTLGSLFLQILLCLGVFGLLFVTVFVLSFMVRTYKYIVNKDDKNSKVSNVCVGLFCTCLNFILLSAFSYTATDTRLIMFFMLCHGLSGSIITSTSNDHISEYVVREHLGNC